MKRRNVAVQLAAISAAVLAAGCGGSSSQGSAVREPQGSLSISLMDAPPIIDAREIWLEIDAIRVKPSDDDDALEFDFDPDVLVDLLALTVDDAEILLDEEEVPAQAYDWIELDANAFFDGVLDSKVVQDTTSGEFELQVPSGSVRLVSGFTVTADQETSFRIDWNTRKGLARPPGRPGYLLRPAFRVIDLTDFGTLSGAIATGLITPATMENGCNDDSPEMNPDVGNVVYVFEGHGVTPEDLGNLDEDDNPTPEPIATLDVIQDGTGDYRYSTIITPGEYTLAFTCQAGLDDPESDEDILFSEPMDVNVIADEETVFDF